jgi:hypothetical protein
MDARFCRRLRIGDIFAGLTGAIAQGCEKIFFEGRKISHMRT